MDNTKISMETSTPAGGDQYTQSSLEAMDRFREGISLILSRWSALQLALWHMGDGHNADKLASKIFHELAFVPLGPLYDDGLEPSHVKAVLEDKTERILEDEMEFLETIAADGSIPEVAAKLVSLLQECFEGNYTSIRKLRQTRTRRVTHQHMRQVDDDDDDDDDEDEDEDEDGDEMEVDRPNMLVDSVVSQSTSRVEVPVEGAKFKD